MTAYCTRDDMLARFDPRTLVQLTDRPADDTVAPATTITDAVLEKAIADASDEIDSYIRSVATLPLAEIPPTINQAASYIALANLYRDAIPEKVAADRERWLRWLRDVRDNKVRLFVDDTTTEGEGAGMPELVYPEREFNARKLRDAL